MLYYIFIEGNIGAGKSTLICEMARQLRMTMSIPVLPILEKVSEWTNVDGVNLLDKVYKDPAGWAYVFQQNVLASRVMQIAETLAEARIDAEVQDVLVLCERSLFSGRHVFAELLHGLGAFNSTQWTLYTTQWKFMRGIAYPGVVAGVVYLDMSVAQCKANVTSRQREGEDVVTEDYLTAVRDAYHDYMYEDEDCWGGAPVRVWTNYWSYLKDIVKKKELARELEDLAVAVIGSVRKNQ